MVALLGIVTVLARGRSDPVFEKLIPHLVTQGGLRTRILTLGFADHIRCHRQYPVRNLPSGSTGIRSFDLSLGNPPHQDVRIGTKTSGEFAGPIRFVMDPHPKGPINDWITIAIRVMNRAPARPPLGTATAMSVAHGGMIPCSSPIKRDLNPHLLVVSADGYQAQADSLLPRTDSFLPRQEEEGAASPWSPRVPRVEWGFRRASDACAHRRRGFGVPGGTCRRAPQ